MQQQKEIKMVFEEAVFNEIKETIGTLPPETGGILLGSLDDFVIKQFILDPHGKTSLSSYDPDIDFLNKKLKEARKKGLDLLGFVHSHPKHVSRLSGDYGNGIGDLGYIEKILDYFPWLEKFYAPIVHSSHTGEFQFFPYVASRGDVKNYQTATLEIRPTTPVEKVIPIEETEVKKIDAQKKMFLLPEEKLSGAVSFNLMQNAHFVCVGIGGANGVCESLVRTGLGKLTIIEFDTVSANNLVTQGFYHDEIGMSKVDALKNRLLRINPALEYNGIAKDFTKLSYEEIKEIMDGASILLMMTDDFHAQAFGNKVSVEYLVPTVFAIMYEKARCSEITFNIPNVTPACHRCATSSRYKAYEEGYENDVTSTGSTVFHTQYLNSVIGLITLAILHRNEADVELGGWFGKYWDRNLVQVRTHPNFGMQEDGLFQRTFTDEPKVFNFDSLWLKVEPETVPTYPEACPDCSGKKLIRNAVTLPTLEEI